MQSQIVKSIDSKKKPSSRLTKDSFLASLKEITDKNSYHISVMNHEMGELRDEQKKMNGSISTMEKEQIKQGKDLEWLNKLLIPIVISSVGSFLMIVVKFAWESFFK